jgi:hypothetical protein
VRFFRRLWYWLNSHKLEAELAEEMAHHRSLLERELGAALRMNR